MHGKMASRLKVVLGTMEMGRRALVEDQPCYDIIDTFVARGYKELDTARMYTGGNSEAIIGRYAATKGHDKLSIATKANPFVNPNGLKRESVLEQAAASLASLQTSCVDIFYLHAPDHNTPLEETLAACQQLYEEGKFKELGLSNFAAWEVADAYHICKRYGWVLPTVYQGMYNAITRMVETELFPALRHFGMHFYEYNPAPPPSFVIKSWGVEPGNKAIYEYNPLAGGLLTGKYKYSDLETKPEGRFFATGGKWSEMYRKRFWRETNFEGIELVRKALDEAYGPGQVSLVSASFRWLNHHSMMKPECNDAIIVGGSKLEHLASNLNACEEGPLDPRVVKSFDAAWELDKANCENYFR